MQTTFRFIDSNKPHIAAAAFTFGREDLIPEMFTGIVRELQQSFQGLALFEFYLRRHIELDGDEHGPMALRMLTSLCGDDPQLWREARQAAVDALEARLALWDAIDAQVEALS